MNIKTAIAFGLACMALGAAMVAIGAWDRPQQIVCESGAFVDARNAADPYLRERAICHFNLATGQPVAVVIID